jgi:hypothetical protein
VRRRKVERMTTLTSSETSDPNINKKGDLKVPQILSDEREHAASGVLPGFRGSLVPLQGSENRSTLINEGSCVKLVSMLVRVKVGSPLEVRKFFLLHQLAHQLRITRRLVGHDEKGRKTEQLSVWG